MSHAPHATPCLNRGPFVRPARWRCCHVLQVSAVIGRDYARVHEYMGYSFWRRGGSMCILALLSWYMTLGKEIQSSAPAPRDGLVPPSFLARGGRVPPSVLACACSAVTSTGLTRPRRVAYRQSPTHHSIHPLAQKPLITRTPWIAQKPTGWRTHISLQSVPTTDKTTIKVDCQGQYRILELSAFRKNLREVTTVIRLVIAGFMTYQGTQYLIYTIAVEELLLNAVTPAPSTK